MRRPSLLLAFAAAALPAATAVHSRHLGPQHPQQASASKSRIDRNAWEGTYPYQGRARRHPPPPPQRPTAAISALNTHNKPVLQRAELTGMLGRAPTPTRR